MHRSLVLGLTLLMGAPSLALAEFTLVVEPGDPADVRSTIQTQVEAAAAVGGQATLTEYNPSTHEVYLLLHFNDDAPASALRSSGTPFHPNGTQVSVLIEALDPATQASKGAPVFLDLSLRELYELRTHPAGQRQTILGAMLRNRWKQALGDLPDDDQVQPRLTPMIRFQAPNGDDGPMIMTQGFSADAIDDLLGRTRRPQERIEAAQANRAPYPLRSISDRLDRRLQRALVKARLQHRDDPAVWNHLNKLRSGAPRRFTPQDHAFLDALMQETPIATPETGPKRKGALGGLEQLTE